MSSNIACFVVAFVVVCSARGGFFAVVAEEHAGCFDQDFAFVGMREFDVAAWEDNAHGSL